MRISIISIIVVCTMATTNGVWFKSERNSFPRAVSKHINPNNHNNRKRVTGGAHLGNEIIPYNVRHNENHGIVSSQAINSMVAIAKPVKQLAVVGIAIAVLYGVAQKLNLPKYMQANLWNRTSEIRDADSVSKLKTEQEEIWNAILSIHNSHKEHQAAIDLNNQRTQDLTAQVSALESTRHSTNEDMQQKLVNILSRLDDLDRSILETSESFSELQTSTDSAELQNKLRAIEDRLEQETAALRASVRQLRDEVPVLMTKQEDIVSNKLSKFKEDLKLLLASANKKK